MMQKPREANLFRGACPRFAAGDGANLLEYDATALPLLEVPTCCDQQRVKVGVEQEGRFYVIAVIPRLEREAIIPVTIRPLADTRSPGAVSW
jgi:hypothetical protein